MNGTIWTPGQTKAEFLLKLHDDRPACENCGETDDIGDTLVTVTVTVRYPTSVALISLCQDCAELARDDLEWSVDVCEDCDSRVTGYDTLSEYIGYGNVERVEFGLDTADTFTFLPREDLGSRVLCWSCVDNYSTCDYCGESDTRDNFGDFCDSCEESRCSDCGPCSCDEEDYYDSDDDGFGGYVTVEQALAKRGEPGAWIRSIRAFGVEFETSGGSGASEDFAKPDKRDLILDVHSEHCGMEFVSAPARGTNGEKAIKDILDTLRAYGYSPNHDCGTHFHLDMTQEDAVSVMRIAAGLRIIEDVIYAMTDSRWTSQWCRPSTTMMTSTTIGAMLDFAERGDGIGTSGLQAYDLQRGRYCAINLHALQSHETIEIRALDGTSDAVRIMATIGLCAGVADFAAATTPDVLRAYIGEPMMMLQCAHAHGHISDNTLAYVERRMDMHNARDYVGAVA